MDMKITGCTYGTIYDPIAKVETQAEADQYFELIVAYTMGAINGSDETVFHLREEAERRVRQNIGYYAGYFDRETQVRVNTLFGVQHPFIPSGTSAEEIVELGRKRALED